MGVNSKVAQSLILNTTDVPLCVRARMPVCECVVLSAGLHELKKMQRLFVIPRREESTVLKAQWKTEINPQKPLSTPHSTHYSQNILGEGVDLILN